jgi:hypothetical protein
LAGEQGKAPAHVPVAAVVAFRERGRIRRTHLVQGLGVQVVGVPQGLAGGLVGLGEGVQALPVRLAVLAAAAAEWGRILLRDCLMALGDLEGAAAHLGRCVVAL